MNILIVGAGPAGLSAALSMAQRGIRARVVEQKEDRATVGSELWLNSANLRTLDALGIAEACVAAGSPITSGTRFMKADGELIAEVMPPKLTRSELPVAVGIQRRALHDALYDACVECGVNIEHGVNLVDIRTSEDSATAIFADGRMETFDLVIGADGVNSAVRRIAFPDAPTPEHVGQFVWRARVPYDGAPRLELFAAPYSGAGFITVSRDTAYVFCLAKGDEGHRIPEERYVVELREVLRQFGGSIGETVDKISDSRYINYSPLRPILVPTTWFRGNVLIIGDAAHAVTPQLAHGAGLAIEDGFVIGEELKRCASASLAAEAFMGRRFERCAFAVETSIKISKLQQRSPFPTPELAGLFDAVLRRLAEPI